MPNNLNFLKKAQYLVDQLIYTGPIVGVGVEVVLGATVRSMFPPVLPLRIEVLAPAGQILMSEKA